MIYYVACPDEQEFLCIGNVEEWLTLAGVQLLLNAVSVAEKDNEKLYQRLNPFREAINQIDLNRLLFFLAFRGGKRLLLVNEDGLGNLQYQSRRTWKEVML